MKFCNECNSLFYSKEIDNKIKYVCKICGNIVDCDDIIIDSNIYKEKELNRGDKNEYTIYDTTLPRTVKKKCPNKTCISHKDISLNEIVLLSDKYTQKLYYTCCNCNTEWTYS